MPDPHLRALRDKYERMLRLRVLHARARDDASFVEPNPRGAMAELARDFPGALREIDELPLSDIETRIAALAAAELDASRVEPWMRAHVAFHALARGALAMKRWLGGRALTAEIERELLAALPEQAALWRGELRAVAAPPRGRVMEVVYARLARDLGVTPVEARALVLPRSARRGAR